MLYISTEIEFPWRPGVINLKNVAVAVLKMKTFTTWAWENLNLFKSLVKEKQSLFYMSSLFARYAFESNPLKPKRLTIGLLLLARSDFRSSPLGVFLRKGVLKICSKFTSEYPCWIVISIKLQSNFIEITLQTWVFTCCCIFSGHLFVKTPLEGCLCKFDVKVLYSKHVYRTLSNIYDGAFLQK